MIETETRGRQGSRQKQAGGCKGGAKRASREAEKSTGVIQIPKSLLFLTLPPLLYFWQEALEDEKSQIRTMREAHRQRHRQGYVKLWLKCLRLDQTIHFRGRGEPAPTPTLNARWCRWTMDCQAASRAAPVHLGEGLRTLLARLRGRVFKCCLFPPRLSFSLPDCLR